MFSDFIKPFYCNIPRNKLLDKYCGIFYILSILYGVSVIKRVVVGIIALCFGILPAKVPENHSADFYILSFPCAVEFLGLDLHQENQSLILQWSTASETENMGFILERKTDSLEVWNPLSDHINNDNLRGQRTVSTLTEYSYRDSLVEVGFTYYYRISGIDIANNIGVLDSASLLVRSTEVTSVLPDNFTLQIYPNPFNPTAIICFSLPEAAFVALNIFDLHGRRISKVCDGNMLNPGNHTITWFAEGIPSGVYFCNLIVSLQTGKKQQITKKILLLK